LPLAAELLLQAAAREPRLAARVSDLEAATRVLAQIGEPLRLYAWPGNVRELQNVIERIAVELADTEGDTADVFTREMLDVVAPELAASPAPQKKDALTLRERSRHVQADEIRAMLAACGGDRDAACKALGISKTTLWRKLNAIQ